MANIIMEEKPLFKKCCFIIPVRLCLQTWAFVKFVADILAITYLVIVTAILCSYEHYGLFKELSIYHWTAMMTVVLLVDFGFLNIFIVGVFKKSLKILRVFYFYEFYAITVEIVVSIILFVNLHFGNTSETVLYAILAVLYILLDICICITIKSEMIKLRNKEQYHFTKMPCDGDIEGTGEFKPAE